MARVFDDFANVEGARSVSGPNVEERRLAGFFINPVPVIKAVCYVAVFLYFKNNHIAQRMYSAGFY